MAGRLDGQGLRDHRRRQRHRRRDGAAVRARRARTVVGVDLEPRRRGRAGARRPTSPTRSRCAGMYERAQRGARPHRRAVQQRRHQPDRRRLGAGDLARGLAAGAGREPAQRLPLLQARHPAPARGRRRVGDQHRLVRRRDGRRRLADLLHRLEGRGAVAVARAGRRVRAPRRARQRALPGAGQHAAAAGAVRRATPRRRRAGSSTCRWAASPRRARSPRRRCSWPATSPPTSPPPRSWSTAASRPPTSRPSSGRAPGSARRARGRARSRRRSRARSARAARRGRGRCGPRPRLLR